MRKKTYYYVLVFDGNGPVYVTSMKHDGWMAYWNKSETPKALPKTIAEETAYGLTINGNHSVVVASPTELDSQPYYYGMGDFKWEDKS